MTSCAPDLLKLTRDLLRCRSITPEDAGAQDVLIHALETLGFEHWDVTRGDKSTNMIRNTFFRHGRQGPHLCFAGHTDVVPPGDESLWSFDPFSATVDNNILYGRGSADMKANVTAFIIAVKRFMQLFPDFKGSISLLITGDEEGEAVYGTAPVLEWMKANDHIPDFCLVGEPSNPERLGDAMKIGRRGSLTCKLVLKGRQGHVAYPDKADNPVPRMAELISRLNEKPLDEGSKFFPPSSLQVSTVDVGNAADNVIPGAVKATFNVRYSDCWDMMGLRAYLEEIMNPFLNKGDEVKWRDSARSFLTEPSAYTDMMAQSVNDITGRFPELKTDGGTSDARFIYHYCPVVEFGLVNKTIHQTDEHVPLEDLENLTQIYTRFLERFFKSATT